MCDHCAESRKLWSYGGYADRCYDCRIRQASNAPRHVRLPMMQTIAAQFLRTPDQVRQAVKDEYEYRSTLRQQQQLTQG